MSHTVYSLPSIAAISNLAVRRLWESIRLALQLSMTYRVRYEAGESATLVVGGRGVSRTGFVVVFLAIPEANEVNKHL